MEKISVIVTNYNHSKYIKTAVESILNQTYENIEIIVIDDCSTDDSKIIIEDIKFQFPEIKTIYLDENKGKWNALNIAISQSSGELITLQDADDASSPFRLQIQYEVLKQQNSIHNLCGFYHCYTEEEIQKYKTHSVSEFAKVMDHEMVLKLVSMGFQTKEIKHYFLGNFEACGASCLFYKNLWENGVKFLPGNMGLRCMPAEDADFNTKLTLLFEKTSIVAEPLYFYRRNTSTNNAWLEGL